MNFETGTSWVTVALDMYLCTVVRPPGSAWRKERFGNGESLAKKSTLRYSGKKRDGRIWSEEMKNKKE